MVQGDSSGSSKRLNFGYSLKVGLTGFVTDWNGVYKKKVKDDSTNFGLTRRMKLPFTELEKTARRVRLWEG